MVANEIKDEAWPKIGIDRSVTSRKALACLVANPFENAGKFSLLVCVIVVFAAKAIGNEAGARPDGPALILAKNFDAPSQIARVNIAEATTSDAKRFLVTQFNH